MADKASRRNFITTSLKYLAGLYAGLLFSVKGLFEPPEIKAASGTDVAAHCAPCAPCTPSCTPTCSPTCSPRCAPGTPGCAPCNPTCAPCTPTCSPCTPSCAPCSPTASCYPCSPNCSPTCSPSCAPYCNPTCPPSGACSMIQVDVPLIEIQRALKRKGYYHGPVDGVWNKETWAAIIEFKRANELKPDGIVTPATWDLLKK
jgi:hypothetical protein